MPLIERNYSCRSASLLCYGSGRTIVQVDRSRTSSLPDTLQGSCAAGGLVLVPRGSCAIQRTLQACHLHRMAFFRTYGDSSVHFPSKVRFGAWLFCLGISFRTGNFYSLIFCNCHQPDSIKPCKQYFRTIICCIRFSDILPVDQTKLKRNLRSCR